MASFIPPLVVGLIRLRALSKKQQVFVAFLGFVILFSTIAEIMVEMQLDKNNLLLYHFYVFVEFYVLLYLFWKSLPGISNGVWLAIVVVFLGLGIYGLWKDPKGYPDLKLTTEAILLIALSFLYYFRMILKPTIKDIHRTFMFWIAAAVMLNFVGNLLNFIFSSTIASDVPDNVYMAVWAIHSLFSIVCYLLYTIALLWKDPTPQS